MTDFENLFANVFGDPQGRTMLWWIADQCGFFATNPADVNPALLSFFNRLMRKGGVTGPEKAGLLMEALMQVAKTRAEIKEEDDDEI